MEDLYNPDEVSIYLQYIDANNEYGWNFNVIMDQSLKSLKWQICLKNTMLIFKEQQKNTSILIQLSWKPLTKIGKTVV